VISFWSCSNQTCLCCAAALLCLSNAKEGGLSGWSSSISVHNDIVRQRPDLARLLAGPWFMDRKGEVPEGKKGYFELPVFNYHQASMPTQTLSVYMSTVQVETDARQRAGHLMITWYYSLGPLHTSIGVGLLCFAWGAELSKTIVVLP